MLLADAEKEITTQLIDVFTTNDISYVLDNAPELGVDQDYELERVECLISMLSSTQASLGGVGTRVFRRTGDIVCRVYTKKDRGTRRDKVIVDTILNKFEGMSFNGIVMEDISFLRVGDVGEWFLTTVRIPFYFHIEDI